jgi:hypothetical protein
LAGDGASLAIPLLHEATVSMWTEFKTFLLKENVLALAIAVVVGAALNKLVTAVVALWRGGSARHSFVPRRPPRPPPSRARTVV